MMNLFDLIAIVTAFGILAALELHRRKLKRDAEREQAERDRHPDYYRADAGDPYADQFDVIDADDYEPDDRPTVKLPPRPGDE